MCLGEYAPIGTLPVRKGWRKSIRGKIEWTVFLSDQLERRTSRNSLFILAVSDRPISRIPAVNMVTGEPYPAK